MSGATLRDKLIAVYSTWLDQDDFGRRYVQAGGPAQAPGAPSVRQFLQELLRLSARPDALIDRPTALEHPGSTLMQLLGSPLVVPGGGSRGLVELLAREALCLRAIPALLHEVSGYLDWTASGTDIPEGRAPDGNVAGAAGGETPERGFGSPVDHADLAATLLAVLKSRLGQRTIRSFFMVDVADNGYRLWDPQRRAPPDAGKMLARHDIQSNCGDVGIDVMRYRHDGESTVRAYEWCAELREDRASELPDAVSYGMAYCFERKMGRPVGGKWDLINAADSVADVDLLQVNAFLEQHSDAGALIEAGDLAFVWLWERRSGSRPGAGRACVQAGLADLCRRLRSIRTVIVDVKPYQFVVSDAAAMPASLHIEKLEAVDRLQSYLDGLRLGDAVKGHCRYIVNQDGEDPAAAMRVLGLAALTMRESPDG